MKLETAEDALHYYWYFLYDMQTGMEMNVKFALKMNDLPKALTEYRNSQRTFIRVLRTCEAILAESAREFESLSAQRTIERAVEVLKLLVDCHSEMQAKIRRASRCYAFALPRRWSRQARSK